MLSYNNKETDEHLNLFLKKCIKLSARIYKMWINDGFCEE